jgi:hypothetical protein
VDERRVVRSKCRVVQCFHRCVGCWRSSFVCGRTVSGSLAVHSYPEHRGAVKRGRGRPAGCPRRAPAGSTRTPGRIHVQVHSSSTGRCGKVRGPEGSVKGRVVGLHSRFSGSGRPPRGRLKEPREAGLSTALEALGEGPPECSREGVGRASGSPSEGPFRGVRRGVRRMAAEREARTTRTTPRPGAVEASRGEWRGRDQRAAWSSSRKPWTTSRHCGSLPTSLSILSTACSTVEWSRPPKKPPISASECRVILRARYIATCRG